MTGYEKEKAVLLKEAAAWDERDGLPCEGALAQEWVENERAQQKLFKGAGFPGQLHTSAVAKS
jgi:hypothetical protein